MLLRAGVEIEFTAVDGFGVAAIWVFPFAPLPIEVAIRFSALAAKQSPSFHKRFTLARAAFKSPCCRAARPKARRRSEAAEGGNS